MLASKVILTLMITKVNIRKVKGANDCMLAQWTAELVGKMHLNNITSKQLAESIGWNPKYLSTVLNGHRNPKNAEKKLNEALESLTRNG